MPSDKGKSIIGSKAVTAMSVTSKTHQIAIQKTAANIATPALDRPSGLTKHRMQKYPNGPNIAASFFKSLSIYKNEMIQNKRNLTWKILS